MKNLGWAVGLCALAALGVGCGDDDGAATDAGTSMDSGGGPADSGPGPGPDASIPPAASMAMNDLTRALSVAAAMGGPLAPAGDMLRRDLAPGDAEGQMRATDGFSGMSVVTPSTCAAYTWASLSATITLTGCTLEALGIPVSGSVTLAVTLRPATFTVTFAALTIGTNTFDGSVTLHAGGTDLGAMPTIDADLTFTGASGSIHLTATGLSTTVTAGSVSVSGAATVTSGTTSYSLELMSVTWATGDCSPSSGSAVVTSTILPLPLTVTFLSTTPMDGIVTAQLGTFPPSMQMLLMACP